MFSYSELNALSNDALLPKISYGFLELDEGSNGTPTLGTNVSKLSGHRGLTSQISRFHIPKAEMLLDVCYFFSRIS